MSLASSQQLFAEFLRITGKLNKFKISPYLMGSLAIEQLGNFFTNPDDIDIQLEKDDYENFAKLTEIMEDLGYQLIDLHEHKFEKEDFMLALQMLKQSIVMRILIIMNFNKISK